MRQQVVDFDSATLYNSEYTLRANALALWDIAFGIVICVGSVICNSPGDLWKIFSRINISPFDFNYIFDKMSIDNDNIGIFDLRFLHGWICFILF